MLEITQQSVTYQAKGRLLDLAIEISEAQNLVKKDIKAKIDEGSTIRYWLKALSPGQYLSPIQKERILYCLIKKANLNGYPVAPILESPTRPDFIIGLPGPKGDQGPRGEDGGGTDFAVYNTVSTGVVDQFPVSSARAARWEYVLYSTTTADQRQGYLLGGWSADGSGLKFFHQATLSIGADTNPAVAMSVDYFAGNVRLIATISSGQWVIGGSRYFIPNNGSGSGPVSANLPLGNIFIGNASNQATAQLPTGDFSITSGGVTSITAGVIVDADINGAANINLGKLASLTPSRAVITDGSGKLITGSVTDVQINSLLGITGNIQIQLDGKIGSVTGAISPYVAVDAIPDRAIISGPTGKLTTSGISTTELGNLVGTIGLIQPQLDAAVQSIGAPVNVLPVNIGDWDMTAAATKSITLVGLGFSSVISVLGHIRDDANTIKTPVSDYQFNNVSTTVSTPIGIAYIIPSGSDTIILLRRKDGSEFDNASYSTTSYNRGVLLISYLA